jgi:hypothetical protein
MKIRYLVESDKKVQQQMQGLKISNDRNKSKSELTSKISKINTLSLDSSITSTIKQYSFENIDYREELKKRYNEAEIRENNFLEEDKKFKNNISKYFEEDKKFKDRFLKSFEDNMKLTAQLTTVLEKLTTAQNNSSNYQVNNFNQTPNVAVAKFIPIRQNTPLTQISEQATMLITDGSNNNQIYFSSDQFPK